MADNSNVKEHISVIERTKWDKCVDDYYNHYGAGGDDNHMRANGSISGFSINDYTWEEKNKLASCDWGALNNPHPATHPWSMIEGLSTVGHTNNYNDLDNRPVFPHAADGCDAATINGIQIFIQDGTPYNVINNKAIWFNTSNKVVYVYYNNTWNPFRAVFG